MLKIIVIYIFIMLVFAQLKFLLNFISILNFNILYNSLILNIKIFCCLFMCKLMI